MAAEKPPIVPTPVENFKKHNPPENRDPTPARENVKQDRIEQREELAKNIKANPQEIATKLEIPLEELKKAILHYEAGEYTNAEDEANALQIIRKILAAKEAGKLPNFEASILASTDGTNYDIKKIETQPDDWHTAKREAFEILLSMKHLEPAATRQLLTNPQNKTLITDYNAKTKEGHAQATEFLSQHTQEFLTAGTLLDLATSFQRAMELRNKIDPQTKFNPEKETLTLELNTEIGKPHRRAMIKGLRSLIGTVNADADSDSDNNENTENHDTTNTQKTTNSTPESTPRTIPTTPELTAAIDKLTPQDREHLNLCPPIPSNHNSGIEWQGNGYYVTVDTTQPPDVIAKYLKEIADEIITEKYLENHEDEQAEEDHDHVRTFKNKRLAYRIYKAELDWSTPDIQPTPTYQFIDQASDLNYAVQLKTPEHKGKTVIQKEKPPVENDDTSESSEYTPEVTKKDLLAMKKKFDKAKISGIVSSYFYGHVKLDINMDGLNDNATPEAMQKTYAELKFSIANIKKFEKAMKDISQAVFHFINHSFRPILVAHEQPDLNLERSIDEGRLDLHISLDSPASKYHEIFMKLSTPKTIKDLPAELRKDYPYQAQQRAYDSAKGLKYKNWLEALADGEIRWTITEWAPTNSANTRVAGGSNWAVEPQVDHDKRTAAEGKQEHENQGAKLNPLMNKYKIPMGTIFPRTKEGTDKMVTGLENLDKALAKLSPNTNLVHLLNQVTLFVFDKNRILEDTHAVEKDSKIGYYNFDVNILATPDEIAAYITKMTKEFVENKDFTKDTAAEAALRAKNPSFMNSRQAFQENRIVYVNGEWKPKTGTDWLGTDNADYSTISNDGIYLDNENYIITINKKIQRDYKIENKLPERITWEYVGKVTMPLIGPVDQIAIKINNTRIIGLYVNANGEITHQASLDGHHIADLAEAKNGKIIIKEKKLFVTPPAKK